MSFAVLLSKGPSANPEQQHWPRMLDFNVLLLEQQVGYEARWETK
jgi:hypothetical protein